LISTEGDRIEWYKLIAMTALLNEPKVGLAITIEIQ
jgi:hypothetical protein